MKFKVLIKRLDLNAKKVLFMTFPLIILVFVLIFSKLKPGANIFLEQRENVSLDEFVEIDYSEEDTTQSKEVIYQAEQRDKQREHYLNTKENFSEVDFYDLVEDVEEVKQMATPSNEKKDSTKGRLSINAALEGRYKDNELKEKPKKRTKPRSSTRSRKDPRIEALKDKIDDLESIAKMIKDKKNGSTGNDEIGFHGGFFDPAAGMSEGNQIEVITFNQNTIEFSNNDDIILLVNKTDTIGGVIIPENTTFSGRLSFSSSRVFIDVQTIKLGSQNINTNLTAIDNQGIRGIPHKSDVVSDLKNDNTNEVLRKGGHNISVGRYFSFSTDAFKRNIQKPTVRIPKGSKLLLTESNHEN